jgi:FRG domain
MQTSSEFCEQLSAFVAEWKRTGSQEKHLGDNPFPRFVLTEQAESWDEFLAWARSLGSGWCFRGQREATWNLSTSLDRACLTPTDSGYYHLNRNTEGTRHLEAFRRSLHKPDAVPADTDLGSWLALGQHYGTPTPFLDWTLSPFIAAYFAFERPACEGAKRAAVWALDLDWLEGRGRELWPSSFGRAAAIAAADPIRWEAKLFDECREPIIIKVNPQEANARMAAQQGVLLCKLFHEAYFSVTLMRMIIYPQVPEHPVLRKLEVDTSHAEYFLQELRAMGIRHDSLFPDTSLLPL